MWMIIQSHEYWLLVKKTKQEASMASVRSSKIKIKEKPASNSEEKCLPRSKICFVEYWCNSDMSRNLFKRLRFSQIHPI